MGQKGKSLLTIERPAHVARIDALSAKVRETFGVFGVALEMVEVKIFPDGICFMLRPVESVRMQVIRSFEDDLRYALGKSRVEILAPIPDQKLIGVTVFMDVRKDIYGIETPNGIVSPWTAELEEEVLYEEAKTIIQETGKASASLLQLKFNIGYSRASLLLTLLEERGVIGPDDGSGRREIYPDR